MEILSPGQRIRRRRIEKNLTMRDLSKGKLTVTKLSLIENDKIVPEEQEFEFLSKELNITYEELTLSVENQIKNILENKNNLSVQDYEYILITAERFKLIEFIFPLLKCIIRHCLEQKNVDKCTEYYYKMWDVLKESHNMHQVIDFAIISNDYFYLLKEMPATLTMFRMFKSQPDLFKKMNSTQKLEILVTYVKSHLYLDMKSDINEDVKGLMEIKEKELSLKEKIYFKCMTMFIKDNVDDKKYENEILNLQEDHLKSELQLMRSKYYYNKNDMDKALIHLNKTLDFLENTSKHRRIEILQQILKFLISKEHYNLAKIQLDSYFRLALELRDDDYIESAYYLKSLIDGINGDLSSSETSLNMSIDLLEKYRNKDLLLERYKDLGILHHRQGKYTEAIRAFSLAEKYS